MAMTFRLASGFYFNVRAIGFLENGDDEELDAGISFNELAGNTRQKVRSEMDYWLQGGFRREWFHGWPNQPEYKQCFVFKWDKNRQAHRLYGFLCHPIPVSNPRFQLCVLIFHALKNEDETNFTILDNVNRLRDDYETTEAISRTYPEYRGKYKCRLQ